MTWVWFSLEKRSLLQLILGINPAHIAHDQEAPHLVFLFWSVQAAQAHPKKGLHCSKKLFLHFPWLVLVWGWGRNCLILDLQCYEVAMGIFATWAISVPLGPCISLKYTFPLYFSCSTVWFSLSLVPLKAYHLPFVHFDVPSNHTSPAEMKQAGEMAGGPFIHHPPSTLHCAITVDGVVKKRPAARIGTSLMKF